MKVLLILIDDSPPDLAWVLIARAEVSNALGEHLATERRAFLTTVDSPDGERFAEAAHSFLAGVSELSVDWRVYLAEWDAHHVADDWQEFRDETRAILGRWAASLTRAAETIYPLALQSGAISLRAVVKH